MIKIRYINQKIKTNKMNMKKIIIIFKTTIIHLNKINNKKFNQLKNKNSSNSNNSKLCNKINSYEIIKNNNRNKTPNLHQKLLKNNFEIFQKVLKK